MTQNLCKLCLQNEATQKNSHIIPKFMTKTILGTGQLQGFVLDTSTTDIPAQKIQDTAKEDYILCPSCESYFSVIERYVANNFHYKLWDTSLTEEFIEKRTGTNSNAIVWKECVKVHPLIFRLFIYSIVWRCSISLTKAHADFVVNNEEGLRKALFDYYGKNIDEIIQLFEKNPANFPVYEFIFVTSESFGDKTANAISTLPLSKEPYFLLLNEYLLLFSFNANEILDRLIPLVNKSGVIKVGFFPEEAWKGIREDFINFFVKAAKKII